MTAERHATVIAPRDSKRELWAYAIGSCVVGSIFALYLICIGRVGDFLTFVLVADMLLIPVFVLVMVWRYPHYETSIMGAVLCGPCSCTGFAIPLIVHRFLPFGVGSAWRLFSILWFGGIALFYAMIVGLVFSVYLAFMARVALIVVQRYRIVPDFADDGHPECVQCGYSLVNLTVARCPECGMAFDHDPFLQSTSVRNGLVEP